MLSNKKNPILKIALITASVLLISVLVINSIIGIIEKKSKSISEKNNLLAAIDKRNENSLKLNDNYAFLKEKMPLIKNSLPNDKNIENFVVALERIALETNNDQSLSFDSIDNSKVSGNKIRSLKFKVTMEGNYATFKDYFNKLNSLPYFFEIYNFEIKNNNNIFNSGSQLIFDGAVFMER